MALMMELSWEIGDGGSFPRIPDNGNRALMIRIAVRVCHGATRWQGTVPSDVMVPGGKEQCMVAGSA